MPGIRIEGRAVPGGRGIPPGVGQEAQLAQAIGGDPYAGLTLAQAQAMQAGGSSFGDNVRLQMSANAAKNSAAVTQSMTVPWNNRSRTAYPNARWEDANYSYIMRGNYAAAQYENRNRDIVSSNTRREAEYENRNRDTISSRTRQEADYERRDRELATARIRRLDYEKRLEAEYENRDRELAATKTRHGQAELRREAEYENRNNDLTYGATRKLAEYENRNRDMAYDKMRREAEYENKEFDRRTKPPSAVSGGGSFGPGGGDGGGGPGGSGGFGFGGGRIPFAHAFGFGATSKLLTGGFGLGLTAEALEELIFAPQTIGRLESSSLSAATPYTNLVENSYRFGRAIGEPGGKALSSVFPGDYKTPDWMKALGLGPTEATAMADQFGILTSSADERQRLIQSLGSYEFLPGTSGVAPEARSSARNAALYGAIEPTAQGTREYGMRLSEVLENATAKGMDRSSVLHSIDASVAMAARSGGAGVSATQLQDFMFRFSNLPGGKTGEAGLQAMAGVGAAMETVGSSPMRTMMTVRAASKLHGEGDLRKLLGDDAFNKTTSTPEGRAAVQNFFQAQKSGNTWASAMWLQTLTQGNPEAQTRILTQSEFFQGLPPEMQALVIGRVSGLGPMGALANQMNPGGVRPGTSGQMLPADFNTKFELTHLGDYRTGLLRMGVPEDQVGTLLFRAGTHGINPLLLGSEMLASRSGALVGPGAQIGGKLNPLSYISQYESENKNVPNYHFDATHTAQGYYQITNTNWREIAPTLGIDLVQYPNAMKAPPEMQAKVAAELYNRYGFSPWSMNPRLMTAVRGIGQGKFATPGAMSGGALAAGAINPGTVSQQDVEQRAADIESQVKAGTYRPSPGAGSLLVAGGGTNEGVPGDVLSNRALVLQATMESSTVTFTEMNHIIPHVNKELEKLASAVKHVTEMFRHLRGTGPSSGNYTPMGSAIPQ